MLFFHVVFLFYYSRGISKAAFACNFPINRDELLWHKLLADLAARNSELLSIKEGTPISQRLLTAISSAIVKSRSSKANQWRTWQSLQSAQNVSNKNIQKTTLNNENEKAWAIQYLFITFLCIYWVLFCRQLPGKQHHPTQAHIFFSTRNCIKQGSWAPAPAAKNVFQLCLPVLLQPSSDLSRPPLCPAKPQGGLERAEAKAGSESKELKTKNHFQIGEMKETTSKFMRQKPCWPRGERWQHSVSGACCPTCKTRYAKGE